MERLVGSSAAMERLRAEIRRAGSTDETVLVTGETGTGKELVAQALQSCSRRCDARFESINCGAIPVTLFSAELFGYERGAFSGASESRPGRIEGADGGTLFLDEIGTMPLEAQSSLLRFLDNQVLVRLGSYREQRVDVRVVAATNAELERDVEAGRFRGDLFHRLNVLRIRVPPLRERGDDVLEVAEHFRDRFQSHQRLRPLTFSDPARGVLRSHDWPGNLRELANRVRRACIVAEGKRIEPVDLDLERRGEPERGKLCLQSARLRAERDTVRAALRIAEGSMSSAARLLNVSRMTLYRIVQRCGLEAELVVDSAEESSGR